MSNITNRIVTILAILILLIAGAAYAQDDAVTSTEVPDEWAATYTAEELAAIDRALWAGNFVREDLNFRKDYTEGYECFPIVREWLQYPMDIAPGMDGIISGIAEYRDGKNSPVAELTEALEYYPGNFSVYFDVTLPDLEPAQLYGPETYDKEGMLSAMTGLASFELNCPYTPEEYSMLRQFMPVQMAWHDIFQSPYSEESIDAWEEYLEGQPDEYLYELMSQIDLPGLAAWYLGACPDPRGWLTDLPSGTWPVLRPVIIEGDHGRIGLGTIFDDEWEGDFTVLIDPGGNDHYINCRIGAAYGSENRNYGYFVDLGGNDFYDCGDTDITLGAAILGVAAFYDLGQGNDRYVAGSCSLGAAMCGIATFYDDGGSDSYESKVYSQGAAGFGVGIMCDDSVQAPPVTSTDEGTPDPVTIGEFDNDHYYAWTNSQAFARTLGFAICSNKRGNEIYEAGGVYLHAPLFADRYQSFSQGFAIGERGIDYAGGIALIVDYDGNDRYLGDIYNQGVGYWYSAGLLYDSAGNDTYEMTQYGQGSGIHLAVGGLIDVAGNDSYTMHSGLGTGGSHDYAASVLHDRGGNDQYFGNTSCNGGSLTNSAVIFIDRSGDDTYAGRRSGGINFGRPARGFPSIGILIDLDGNDDYLGIMDNGMLWTHTNVGVGWDVIPPPVPEEEIAGEPERGQLGEDVELPDVISFEGDLTQEVFDELWEISIRWEVGDNRFIVPHARDRLIAFGPEVLPYLSQVFDNMNSGLAIRAFDVILGAFMETDRDGVVQVLIENLEGDEDMRRRIALAEIATLKVTELEDIVADILHDPDPAFQRRAIGVIGALESHAADIQLIANLATWDDEALIKVSMETLFSLGVDCYDELRPLLDHPYISVRETLVGLFAAHTDLYESDLFRDLLENATPTNLRHSPPPLEARALRSLLKVFRTSEMVPDAGIIEAVSVLLDHEDWGVRADAIEVVQHWQDMAVPPEPSEESAELTAEEVVEEIDYDALRILIQPLVDKVELLIENETDPYVLFIGTRER